MVRIRDYTNENICSNQPLSMEACKANTEKSLSRPFSLCFWGPLGSNRTLAARFGSVQPEHVEELHDLLVTGSRTPIQNSLTYPVTLMLNTPYA